MRVCVLVILPLQGLDSLGKGIFHLVHEPASLLEVVGGCSWGGVYRRSDGQCEDDGGWDSDAHFCCRVRGGLSKKRRVCKVNVERMSVDRLLRCS